MSFRMRKKGILWLVFLIGAFSLYLAPLWNLFNFARRSSTFDYILLIPMVSAYFLYEYRRNIFLDSKKLHFFGLAPIALALMLYAVGVFQDGRLAPPDHLGLMALSFVVLLVGGLWFFCGIDALKAAAFPMFFLVFITPIPTVVLDKIVSFLQNWSADVSYVFFRLTGVPMYRDGFLFHLPGLSIEVAKQCSGIRSSIALFLVSILAGHLFLRGNSRKVILTLSIVPIAIVKNAVRIVTLSMLAVYVDPRILGTIAHRRGGIPIFLLALLLLGCVLLYLRRTESRESFHERANTPTR